MKTAEQILAQYIYGTDVTMEECLAEASVMISELKSEGYIVVKADTLAKQISSAMTVGGAFVE